MAELSSGTTTVFNMTTALTGWTKITTLNDYMLRVVSGSVSSGGSQGFSSIFQTQTPTGTVGSFGTAGTDSTVLTAPQMGLHTHGIQTLTAQLPPTPNPGAASVIRTGITPSAPQGLNPGAGSPVSPGAPLGVPGLVAETTSVTGSNVGHSHPVQITSPGTMTATSIPLDVKYVDVILATRD